MARDRRGCDALRFERQPQTRRLRDRRAPSELCGRKRRTLLYVVWYQCLHYCWNRYDYYHRANYIKQLLEFHYDLVLDHDRTRTGPDALGTAWRNRMDGTYHLPVSIHMYGSKPALLLPECPVTTAREGWDRTDGTLAAPFQPAVSQEIYGWV
ncbi:hypothetical protein DFH09DRAFT_1075774 [Mycena vulgaris]|nr:hypothetical protein DFH09DRAFT_1075774 [Mycena vulgaris]